MSGCYSQYPVTTFFRFYKENGGGGSGWNGVDVCRLDFILSYNIFEKSKFILQPNFGLGIQKSISQDVGIIGGDIPDGIKPDNFELLKDIKHLHIQILSWFQFFSLKFSYAFLSRLELFLIFNKSLVIKSYKS